MEITYRSSCRAQVTRIVNDVNKYLSTKAIPKSPNDINEEVEEDLEVFLKRLQTAHENLCKANEAVGGLNDKENQVKEYDAILEYEDKAISALARLEKRRSNYYALKGSSNSNRTNGNDNKQPNSQERLPKIELKRFSGNINEWLPFWEQYKISIHDNTYLSAATKFNYLQSLLAGKAAAAIAGFTPTEMCYTDAITLLKEQFGNTDKIVERLMHELMSLAPVKSKINAPALRSLYNFVTSTIRSLAALNVPSKQYNMMLRSILLRALPAEMRVEFFRKSSNDDGDTTNVAETLNSTALCDGDQNLRKLLSYIKNEVEALEMAEASHIGERQESNTKRGNASSGSKAYTAAGLMTSSPSIKRCIFCTSSEHLSPECNSSQTVDERKQILRKNGCCYRCTKGNHSSKDCRTKRFLKCKRCNGRHASAMCDPSFKVATKKGQNLRVEGDKNQGNSLNLVATNDQLCDVFLQTACVYVGAPNVNNHVFIRLVLDSGSQMSFIRQDVSRNLNLPVVGSQRLSVLPFGSGKKPPACLYNKVRVQLQSQYDQRKVEVVVIEVPEICLDFLTIPNQNNAMYRNIELADARIDGIAPLPGINLLIGADNYCNIVTDERISLSESLSAINTAFGWTLLGPALHNEVCTANFINTVSLFLNIDKAYDFSNFWSLEAIGINSEIPKNEGFTEDFIKNCVVLRGNRYEVRLPWKSENITLYNNKANAWARLKSLTRKLSRDPCKLEEYDQAIRNYMNGGFAEVVPSPACNDRIYYMPHRGVYREDKSTTRLRIVFDASSHDTGVTSLNDNLWSGENLNTELYAMLLNFRLGHIALTADIEKAFLQICLAEADRDVHRFLWYRDNWEKITETSPVCEYRMCRVTFGVTSSPFLLASTIHKHLQKMQNRFPEVCKIIKRSFYVDDLIVSMNDMKLAKKLYHQSVEVMGSAGMNLRKWQTNSKDLKEVFINEATNNEHGDRNKVLGLVWWASSDEIAIDFSAIKTLPESEYFGTKRNILKMLSRIYDPLGILGPFTVRLKLLFQTTWRIKMDWDTMLPDDLLKTWTKLRQEFSHLGIMSVPRCVLEYNLNEGDDVSLHVFADASPRAYGAVAYIRHQSNQGNVSVRFLCSKNRIAPLSENGSSELSLPKMELTAALVAGRLQHYLNNTLTIKIQRTYLWSDSKIVIYWIKGDPSKWKPYVKNRVGEIQKQCINAEWRHCPGNENPADLLTRGITALNLVNSSVWLSGPMFLRDECQNWPSPDDVSDNNIESLVVFFQSTLIIPLQDETQPLSLLDLEKYSSLGKLLRITGYIIRFVNELKKRERNMPINDKYSVLNFTAVSVDEIRLAEIYWIRYTQEQVYNLEINALKNGKIIEHTSKIATLNPFLDDNGLLRVGGRIEQANFNFDLTHPIILPKHGVFNELIIKDQHNKLHHGGVELVLSHIRQRFWMIKGRQTIKRIISRCLICKRLRGKPATEAFAPLPKERINFAKPFQTTGIDFAGPLYVSRNESRNKVYILLLTCAVTRAVHLELVPNLSTETFIQALRRFIARRGVPSLIYSDNAKTFRRADMELRELEKFVNTKDTYSFMTSQGIKWRFIIERAAWWGGWWERLIKTVKDALRLTIGKRILNYDQLHTLLTEVEATINSRPITYISDDPSVLQALTPSHFLLGDSVHLPTVGKFPINSINNNDLVEMWKRRQQLAKVFRKRWVTEYLQQLRSAHHSPRMFSRSVKTGDVVLIHDQVVPRLFWKMGVIERLYPGRDGKTRACEVRTSTGILRRPIQLLYPLEVQ